MENEKWLEEIIESVEMKQAITNLQAELEDLRSQLVRTKAELEKVKAENERLRKLLIDTYESLQTFNPMIENKEIGKIIKTEANDNGGTE